MNWEAIGAVGEIIGAIGVIATLIYVAYQLRQSTKQTNLNTLALQGASEENIGSIGNFMRMQIAGDRETAELYAKGLNNPESLDSVDQIRFRILIDAQLEIFQIALHQIVDGRRSDTEWDRIKPIIRRSFLTNGGKWYWDKHKHEWNYDIRNAISDIMKENEI